VNKRDAVVDSVLLAIILDALRLLAIRRDRDVLGASDCKCNGRLSGARFQRLHTWLNPVANKSKHIGWDGPVGGLAVRPSMKMRAILNQPIEVRHLMALFRALEKLVTDP